MSLVRTTLALAALCAAAALAAPGGNVNGTAEQPVIEKISECLTLESQAAGIVSDVGDKDDLTDEQNTALDAKLDEAIACLTQAIADLDAARPNFQPSTDADGAKSSLETAKTEDEKCKRSNTGKKVRVRLGRANSAKRDAIRKLQGIKEADNRTGLKVTTTPSDSAYAFDGSSKKPDKTRGWTGDTSGGRASRGSRPRPSKSGPPDYYLAFTGTGPTGNGFAFFNMQRSMRGPFTSYHSAGFMSTSAAAEAVAGNAFSCMEFDVVGSSPLQFLSICARFTNGGLQAFASSRTSSNLGQVFLAGVRVATFKTTYDGVTFTMFVKAEGASDSTYQQFATYVHDQGSSLQWVAGVGGAQLAAKAEVGIDDVVIEAQ